MDKNNEEIIKCFKNPVKGMFQISLDQYSDIAGLMITIKATGNPRPLEKSGGI